MWKPLWLHWRRLALKPYSWGTIIAILGAAYPPLDFHLLCQRSVMGDIQGTAGMVIGSGEPGLSD
jgi:hypothetical protein